MALPNNFSHTEHLQDAVKRAMNKEVAKFFRDLGGDDWEPNVNSSRASARTACTHQESDTIGMTNLRLMLFRHFVNGGDTNTAPVYGIPREEYDATVTYRPQAILHFQQRIQDVKEGFSPVTAQISVRLKEQSTEITESQLRSLAATIKSIFGGTTGYKWEKGRRMFSYVDKANGHQFKVYCKSKETGRDLVSKMLLLVGDTPDWSLANYKSNQSEAQAYPAISGTEVILGKSRKKARRRPIANVYFQVAHLHVQHLPNAIPLYDRSGVYPKALIREYGN